MCTVLLSCSPGDSTGPFDIVWVGDILLADAAQEDLELSGYDWPFDRLLQTIDGDYLIGNAEGPITQLTEPYFPDQEFEYNADPAAAAALADVGFDAVSLSNNHALDRGPEGLADTVRHLEDAGIVPFGAGTIDAAEAPLLVSTPHGTVAVVALGEDWNAGAVASETTPGTVPLSPETIERGYLLAIEAGAQWVVAYVHWGENYSPVDDRQRELGVLFAVAGYDLVIGHHPHVVQPVEVIGATPLIYSIGNFAFGTPGRFDADAPGYGLVVRTAFGAEDEPRIQLTCIVTDNEVVAFQPHLCSAAESRKVFGELGPAVRILDDTTAEVVADG